MLRSIFFYMVKKGLIDMSSCQQNSSNKNVSTELLLSSLGLMSQRTASHTKSILQTYKPNTSFIITMVLVEIYYLPSQYFMTKLSQYIFDK